MNKITINFTVPQSWSELSDKQLRKVYELIAADMDADEIKIFLTSSLRHPKRPERSGVAAMNDARG